LEGLFVSETATVRFWTGHGYVPEYSSGCFAEGQVSIPWPVAYYFMDRWLKDFAFRIDTGIWTFVLSDVLALVIAFLTVSCHPVKAAMANPVDSLRHE